jgi:4-hydroxy-tetrahydrodipicolinate reductase
MSCAAYRRNADAYGPNADPANAGVIVAGNGDGRRRDGAGRSADGLARRPVKLASSQDSELCGIGLRAAQEAGEVFSSVSTFTGKKPAQRSLSSAVRPVEERAPSCMLRPSSEREMSVAKHGILVAGVAGRMGKAVVAEILATPGVSLAGGCERAENPAIGADIGNLAGCDALGLAVAPSPQAAGLKRAAALIDFTAPAASVENARAAAEAGVALVLGTTGLTSAQEDVVREAAKKIPIVRSGNMSLGVNLLAALVEEAARRLSDDYDIEIFEAHHRDKVDAPSGTALMLGRAAAQGRGVDLASKAVYGRTGETGPRKAGNIGFAVMRGGGIVGEHEVTFAGSQEIITLSHSAIDRGLFARGAVAADKSAVGKTPGLNSMRDV